MQPNQSISIFLKELERHGGWETSPVAENLPCNPGDSGLIPGWGAKISHAATKIPRATETPGSQINQSVFF